MGVKIPNPIFIGGCDRSGTTMLGAMLGSHSEILSVPEAQFILEVYKEAYRKKFLDSPSKILKAIKSHLRFQLWGVDVGSLTEKTDWSEISYADVICMVVKQYALGVDKVGASFWVDHVPGNIRNTFVLLELFPTAKFIHIVRDGRAVASSLASVRWGPSSIDRIANWWMMYIAHGLAAENVLGSKKIIRIAYEDLVQNSQKTLGEICQFIGLQFESGMIEGKGLRLPAFYRKDQHLVGKVPDERRVSAWQKSLHSRDIEIFESFTGDILLNLGYPTLYYPSTKGFSTFDRLRSLLKIPSETIGNYMNGIKLVINARFRGKR